MIDARQEVLSRVKRMAGDAAAMARGGRSIRENWPSDEPSSESLAAEWQVALADDQSQLQYLDHGLILSLQQLMAAEDCLLAMESLAKYLPEQLMAVSPLARTTIEAAAQAHWLMKAESGSDLAGRYVGLTSSAVLNAERWAGLLGHEEHHPGRRELAEYQRDLAEFDGPVTGPPDRTTLVGAFLESLGLAGRGTRLAYGWLSSTAHAEKLGIDQIIEGPMWRPSQVSVPDRGSMEWMIWAAGMSYGWATFHVYERIGWDHETVAAGPRAPGVEAPGVL